MTAIILPASPHETKQISMFQSYQFAGLYVYIYEGDICDGSWVMLEGREEHC